MQNNFEFQFTWQQIKVLQQLKHKISGVWMPFLLPNQHWLETKASSREGQCIPAGSNVSLVENVEKKTASKSMHWRRYRSSNWYEIEQKMRFQIWRSVVAPCDARDKNRIIGAQLQSILYTTAGKRFWKIYFLYDFWCAQTCTFRAVFALPIRTLTLAVSAM